MIRARKAIMAPALRSLFHASEAEKSQARRAGPNLLSNTAITSGRSSTIPRDLHCTNLRELTEESVRA